jgi:Zn-dependent alcohol dehydrogenase
VREELGRIVGASGVDVAIENTGNVALIEAAYALTNARGRTVLVGVPPQGATAALSTLPLHFEKRIHGSHGGDARPDLDIPRYLRLLDAGKLDLSRLVGRRYRLEDINDAIDDMRTGRLAGRAMIVFGDAVGYGA